jgi:hypothetical protein
LWIKHHERSHVARVGREKVEAFMCLLALRGIHMPETTALEKTALGYREFNLTGIVEAGREVFG